MQALTINHNKSILAVPLEKGAVGIETPLIGHNRPLITVAFLRSSFLRVLKRAYSMVGCIGQPLWLAGAYAGSLNPIQSATQSMRPLLGGLSLLHRINRMNTNSPGLQSAQQNQPINSVSALFDCFLHRRQIASSITGAKAECIKRHNQAVVVKFAGFGGAL